MMSVTTYRSPVIVMAIIVATSGLAGSLAAPPAATELAGRTMGTTYHVKYWGAGVAEPPVVQATIDLLLADVDRQMSTYRDDSELSQFNRAPANQWFPVSRETAEVVRAALDFHAKTGGILDVTVGPLLKLWNFGPHASASKPLRPPSEQALCRALATMGSKHLHCRLNPPALCKDRAALEVELSSLAPGYAVDLIIDRLCRMSFPNAMVEIGGEVRAVGLRPDGAPWKIGVERPLGQGAGFARIVSLRDLAISTAGDYRISQSVAGHGYTHIIDPRTGEALPQRGASVTVLAKTCLEADALDTPLLVMGAREGYDWCLKHEVAAMFQSVDDGGRLTVKTTPRFDQLAEAP